MSDYQDRLVIVTGGAGALGSSVVERLLAAGARVAIPLAPGEDPDRCSFKDDDRVSFSPDVDLTDESAVEAFYKEAGENLWASLNIAGGFGMGPIDEVTTEDFEKLFRMNALTCLLCTREAVRHMRKSAHDGGRIVNVAAKAALHPEEGAGMSIYTASKAAVVGLTLSVAAEVKKDNIWVNAIAPSIMDTGANRKAMPDADHDAWPSTADVAVTVCFLASSENRVTRAGVVPVYGRS